MTVEEQGIEEQLELGAEGEPAIEEPSVPSDSDRIVALEARLEQEKEARIRLEAANTARAEMPTAPQKPVVTREKLQRAVADGSIEQWQADDAMATQRTEDDRVQREAENKRLQTEIHERETLTAHLTTYRERLPEIDVPGSDTRRKVEGEYQFLTSLGEPVGGPGDIATLRAEVKACRAAFGAPDRIPERTRERRQTHQETSTGTPHTSQGRNVDVANKIPAKYRDHYRRMIDIGQYTGWDDKRIAKDLKYMGNVQ